jgi:hypothetical protein
MVRKHLISAIDREQIIYAFNCEPKTYAQMMQGNNEADRDTAEHFKSLGITVSKAE